MIPIFAFGAFVLLVYTYVGYPVLIAAAARMRPRHVARDPAYEPFVSALIPVYNAADYLERKLESLSSLDYPRDRFEIIVYVDGATDETARVAMRHAVRDPRVRVLENERRCGKPTALNRMAEVARGDVLLLTDARQPLAPGALRALVSALADPQVACASGNLVLRGDSGAGMYWRYENWIRRNEARFGSTIGATGPIYAIRRECFRPLPADVILDDVWLPIQARLEGGRTVLVQDAIAYDEAFDDHREYGRKARTLAGNYQLLARMPQLLNPLRNRSWLETVSHKLCRLAAPWALIVLAVATSAALWPGVVAEPTSRAALWVLLIGQVVVYGLASAGGRAGRIGAAARSFVVFNAAALTGLGRFVGGRQRVTW